MELIDLNGPYRSEWTAPPYRQDSTRNHLTKFPVKLFIIYLERPLGIVTKFTWGLLSKYPGGLGQDPCKGKKQVGSHLKENVKLSMETNTFKSIRFELLAKYKHFTQMNYLIY